MENIGKGMPLFRIEDTFEREDVAIDRGTLSRWKKQVGDESAKPSAWLASSPAP